MIQASEKGNALLLDFLYLAAVILIGTAERIAVCIFSEAGVLTLPYILKSGIPDLILSALVAALVMKIRQNRRLAAGAALFIFVLPSAAADRFLDGCGNILPAFCLLLLIYMGISLKNRIFQAAAGVLLAGIPFAEAIYKAGIAWNRGLTETDHYSGLYVLLGSWKDRSAGAAGIAAAAAWIILLVCLYRRLDDMEEDRQGWYFLFLFTLGSSAAAFLPYLGKGAGYLSDLMAVLYLVRKPERWKLPVLWLALSSFSAVQRLSVLAAGSGKMAEPVNAMLRENTLIGLGRTGIVILLAGVMLEEIRKNAEKSRKAADAYQMVFPAAGLLILGLAARLAVSGLVSDDYTKFLSVWMNTMYQNGGFRSLRLEISDYTTPYITFLSFLTAVIPKEKSYFCMYAIKIFSCLFDMMNSILVYRMVKKISGSLHRSIFAAAAVFLLPTVFMNSAAWGQCDAIYTFFLLLFIYELQQEKPLKAVAGISMALCIKLQTVFFLPVLAIALLQKKVKWRQLLLFPLIYFLSIIPALAMGRPLLSILEIYWKETKEFSAALSMHAVNIYYLTGVRAPDILGQLGMLLAFMLLGTFVYWNSRWNTQSFTEPDGLILITLICIAICYYLLPHMHERYGYAADILILVYAMLRTEMWNVAALWCIVSMIPYLWYLTGYLAVDMRILSAVQLGMILYLVWKYKEESRKKRFTQSV